MAELVQEIGVVVIVLVAIVFLARKFFVRSKPKPSPTAFIPLGSLKKKSERRPT